MLSATLVLAESTETCAEIAEREVVNHLRIIIVSTVSGWCVSNSPLGAGGSGGQELGK